MGSPKVVLPYGTTTMVRAVVGAVVAADLSPVIVVTGFHGGVVGEAVGRSARVVHNPHPESGNLSSLLIGLDALGDVDGAVVVLADMPGVQSEVVAALADGLIESGSLGGWVEYADGWGHPMAIGRSAFDDVRALTGPRPLWPFLSSLRGEDTFILHVDSTRPIDVNTPEDHERVTRSGDKP
jgi:CTP:molybdopterin cytidylyltransferase MocA